jgi:predicted nuclease of restriction endonuclease-like (RecB) superfamily
MSIKRKPKKAAKTVRSDFAALFSDVKGRIQSAQTRAVLAANAELVRLYWDIGRIIEERQRREGWGTGVIPRLARELHNELPELKGFSERNIGRMISFYREYPDPSAIVPQAVAQLPASSILPPAVAKLPKSKIVQQPVAQLPAISILPQPAAKLDGLAILPQAAAKLDRSAIVPQAAAQLGDGTFWAIPWFHHVIILEKVKDHSTRRWYMEQTLANGWSRNVLAMQIDAQAHVRHGKAISNFAALLPGPQSDLAQQALKDPYIFDFLTLTEPFQERELETQLVLQLEKFLLELGQGFAFVGRQYRLDVGDEDFYIDLLFYHLRLRAFVVIDLKKGKFKPEYAGKLNFYCNVVNDRLKHPADQPTIGLILCQTHDRLLAEYSFAGIDKPIGISTYELTRALPASLRSSLPSVEEIEAELANAAKRLDPPKANKPRRRKHKTKRVGKG